jgi:hypothetical protein
MRKRNRRLAEEDVAQIKAHLQQGKRPAIIARYFEVDQGAFTASVLTKSIDMSPPLQRQRLYRKYLRRKDEYEPSLLTLLR